MESCVDAPDCDGYRYCLQLHHSHDPPLPENRFRRPALAPATPPADEP
jgi:hypothetical protein